MSQDTEIVMDFSGENVWTYTVQSTVQRLVQRILRAEEAEAEGLLEQAFMAGYVLSMYDCYPHPADERPPGFREWLDAKKAELLP